MNRSLTTSQTNNQPQNGEDPPSEVELMLDRVNELWKRVEKKLLRRQPPRHIAIEASRQTVFGHEGAPCLDRNFLGIQRNRGKWRVCHAETWMQHDETDEYIFSDFIPASLDWRPITECDLSTRMAMAEHIAKLTEEVDDTGRVFIPKLSQAINYLKEAEDALAD